MRARASARRAGKPALVHACACALTCGPLVVHDRLYKHQYVLAGWSWKRGITRTEYWNEPDLSSSCIYGATWIEHVTLRSMAIQHAYADFNADWAAGRFPNCPLPGRCPITPVVLGSAFSSASYGTSSVAANVPVGGPFGLQTMANQYLTFPPGAAITNPSWRNTNAFSWHSYGKTGHALQLATASLAASSTATLAGLSPAAPAVPVVTTEHQSHTNGQWNTYNSTVRAGAARAAAPLCDALTCTRCPISPFPFSARRRRAPLRRRAWRTTW